MRAKNELKQNEMIESAVHLCIIEFNFAIDQWLPRICGKQYGLWKVNSCIINVEDIYSSN